MAQIAYALLQNMRPKQWAKNAFVFAGIVFDQQLDDREPLLRVLAAFVLLCMMASTIYLINDLADLEKDRQHPKKKFRPLASGRLPVPVAIVGGGCAATRGAGRGAGLQPSVGGGAVGLFDSAHRL